MNATRTLAALLAASLLAVATAQAQVKKSGNVVKATATGGKVEGGKQTVTIALDIDPKYHLYANPVGNDLLTDAQLVVSFGKAKAEVKYPPGMLKKDTAGDYMIYKGKVVVTAVVSRPEGKTPLEASIAVQACTNSTCLQPSTIKLMVK